MLSRHTIADIRAPELCYDPARYLSEDWTGTALDLLRVHTYPAEERLQVVLREKWIPNHVLHAFACDCVERVLVRERECGREPDPRSWRAIETKRMWLRGAATDEELAAARDAAEAAVVGTTCDGAWVAAKLAAWVTGSETAGLMAWDAAASDAWAAERQWQARWFAEPQHALVCCPLVQPERQWQVQRLVDLLQEEQDAET